MPQGDALTPLAGLPSIPGLYASITGLQRTRRSGRRGSRTCGPPTAPLVAIERLRPPQLRRAQHGGALLRAPRPDSRSRHPLRQTSACYRATRIIAAIVPRLREDPQDGLSAYQLTGPRCSGNQTDATRTTTAVLAVISTSHRPP